MPNISYLLDGLQKHLDNQADEAREASVCKYCGNQKKPMEYRKDNLYRCHGCGAEWPKLFDNYFWEEWHEDLYDRLKPTYCIK